MVTTWSAPAAESRSATSLTVMMMVTTLMMMIAMMMSVTMMVVLVLVVIAMTMVVVTMTIILGHDWSPWFVDLVSPSKGVVGDHHRDRGCKDLADDLDDD